MANIQSKNTSKLKKKKKLILNKYDSYKSHGNFVLIPKAWRIIGQYTNFGTPETIEFVSFATEHFILH